MVASKKLIHKMAYVGLISGLVGGFTNVNAAGFQIQEQNVSNLGNAYAGAGSYASDASTAFYNPAGLMRLDGKNISVGNIFIHARSHLRVSSATATFPNPFTGAPIAVSGNMDDDPGGLFSIPSLHYSARLTDRVAFGLSVSSPYGLKTEYGLSSPARYSATKSKLTTIDIKPSIAVQLLDSLSFAASFDIVEGIAQLNAAIGNNGLVPDGYVKISLKDVSYGFGASFLYDLNDHSRAGFAYRSPITFHGKGARFTYIGGIGLMSTLPSRGKLTVPEVYLLSYYSDFNPCWALMADLQFTRWERFRILQIDFLGMPPTPSLVVNENFKNAVRFSVGLNYTYNPIWTFKTGVSLDTSPVVEIYRTARVPDSDRIWLAFGARYNLRKHVSVDFGYAHLFFKKARINEVGQPGTFVTLNGRYESAADMVGLQLNWKFDQ